MKKIVIAVAAIAALLALPACITQKSVTTDANGNSVTNTTTTLDIARVTSGCKEAATIGTQDILAAHPEWRPQFQQAEDDLNLLAASPSVSLNDILAIVQRLPVKELKSSAARLSFQGAIFVISLFNVPQVPATANADIKAIAKSIADGIAPGIAGAPPVPVKAPVFAPLPSPTTNVVVLPPN